MFWGTSPYGLPASGSPYDYMYTGSDPRRGTRRGAGRRKPFMVDGQALKRDDAIDFFFSAQEFDDGDNKWYMAQIYRLSKEDPQRAQLAFWNAGGGESCVIVHCETDRKLLAPLGTKTGGADKPSSSNTSTTSTKTRGRGGGGWFSSFGFGGRSRHHDTPAAAPDPLDHSPVEDEEEEHADPEMELGPPPAAPKLTSSLTEMAPPRMSREMSSLGRLLLEDAIQGNDFRAPGSRSLNDADMSALDAAAAAAVADPDALIHDTADPDAAGGAAGGGVRTRSGSAAGQDVDTKIELGDMVDVREADTKRWQPATVINMSKDATGKPFIKVEHTNGLVTEWVPLGSMRFAELGKHSTRLHHSFTRGEYIDALDFFPNKYTGVMTKKWRVAFVLEAEPYRVKIHWEGWSYKFDCWIDVVNEGDRLRPLGRHTVGDGEAAQRERELEEQFSDALLKGDPALIIHEVQGDGNCLFRSVAHQVFNDDSRHSTLRERCMRYVKRNKSHFKNYVDGGFDDYVQSRTKNGVWGDNLEIVAMAEMLDRPVEVYSREAPINADGTLEPMRVVQADESSRPVVPIRLSYHGGRHYNSVVDSTQPPPLGELGTTVLRNQRLKREAAERKGKK